MHPVFVAFVDRLAGYLSGSERLSGSRLVDSFVQLRAASGPAAEAGSVEVIAPDGRRALSLQRGAHCTKLFAWTQAGFYQIRMANGRDMRRLE